MKPKAITLLSGGLDSAVATALAMDGHDLMLALTFDYGQRSIKKEIEASRSLCKYWGGIEHKIIELPWLEGETKTALVDKRKSLPSVESEDLNHGGENRADMVWVPNRNAIFVSIAACFAEARGCAAIVAGLNAEEAETFPDNSMTFLDATNRALELSTRSGVRLICPTIEMTKAQIAMKLLNLKIPTDLLWPCYEGHDLLCGRCESCARTIRAFKTAGAWNLIERRFADRRGASS